MGSSFSWHANADSPSAPGEKSVMSDPIDGVTAENLLEGMQKYVQDGKTATGRESKFQVIDKGDHLVVALEFEVPALFGGGSGSAFTTYYFDKEKLHMLSRFYQSKKHYEDNDAQCTNMVQIHNNPVKIEFWAKYNKCRSSGLFMEKMLAKVLQEMGTSAKALPDHASPDDATKLSVLSEPITDVKVTPDTFVAFFKSFIVETMEGTALPDGSVVEERGSLLLDTMGLVAKAFAKHDFREDERHVYCHEYGDDESMSEEIGVTHVHVHAEPFRIEQYNVSHEGRRSGEAQRKLIEAFVSGVLKSMQG